MKKGALCLMIACLSLFAVPYEANAGTVAITPPDKTERAAPVMTPRLEKKIDEFKKKHPDMFSKKETKSESESASSKHGHGGVYYISGTALVLIIILLIILL